MSFAIATPPLHNDETDVITQTWWPNLSLKDAREILRLDGTVTTSRLLEALTNAGYSVNAELSEWKQAQIVKGVERLETEREVHLYLRAVYFTAHADLLERYRNYDSTGSGEKRALDFDDVIGSSQRKSWLALRDIQGLTRVVVEML